MHTPLLDYFKSAATDVGAGFNDFLEMFVVNSLLDPGAAAADVPEMLAKDVSLSRQCGANATAQAFRDAKQKAEEVKDLFANLKQQVQTTIDAAGSLVDALDNSMTGVVEKRRRCRIR